MKVALVHDDLVQWGGAERVLTGLCEIFPDSPIFTSVFDKDNKKLQNTFGSKKIVTSFLQKLPFWKSMYKNLLPLYPIAFEQFDFDTFDLVISHTTRFAKSIITKPQTKHICYCHTPPRFLWHFSGEKDYGLGELLMTKLRILDTISSRKVDFFLAGSENAKRRIIKIYRQDSKVVFPFVDMDRFATVDTFDGGYFLIVTRLNRYKKADLAIDACMKLGVPLKIIGEGGEMGNLKNKIQNIDSKKNLIQILGGVDDETVILLLAGCRALIIPGIEDFGITSLEAQALGKPVIAYKEGGSLETVIDGKTGVFFENQTAESLVEALAKIEQIKIKAQDCKDNANLFNKDRFRREFVQSLADLGYTV